MDRSSSVGEMEMDCNFTFGGRLARDEPLDWPSSLLCMVKWIALIIGACLRSTRSEKSCRGLLAWINAHVLALSSRVRLEGPLSHPSVLMATLMIDKYYFS